MRTKFPTPIHIGLAVAAIVVGVAILLLGTMDRHKSMQQVAIGGPFKLTTQTGETLSNEDLKGKPFAIFFGFTHCPEVCPTTLWDMTKALERLGPDGDRLRVLFVSLDPERDTPAQMRDYLTAFDPRIVALTGSRADIEALAQAYRVYWQRIPTDDGSYTLDHTAVVFLMDARGDFAGVINYQEKPERRDQLLRQLIGAAPAS